MSVFVKICDYPPGIDERNFAELLLKIMDAHGKTFRQCFLSCEIRYEESVAVLEFEHLQNTSPWTKLTNININGRTLRILNDSGEPKHQTLSGSKSAIDLEEPDLESTIASVDPVSNGGMTGVESSSCEPAVENEVASENVFEDMDVDEGVGSTEETSPLGTPPDTTANDNLLQLLSEVTTSTSAYFPTISSEVVTVEKVQSEPNKSQLAEPASSDASRVSVNGSIANALSKRTVVIVSSQSAFIPPVSSQQSVVSLPQRNLRPAILAKPMPTSSVSQTDLTPIILPELVPISNGAVTKPVALVAPKSKPPPKLAASQPTSGRPIRTLKQASRQPNKLSTQAVSQSTGGVPNKPLSSGKRVVYFDLETTGLERATCEIVQIAAACGDAHFNVYIKPLNGIPIEASRVNGLTMLNNQLLKNGVAVQVVEHSEAWKGLISFLKGLGKVLLVGHNADWFDFPLMTRDIKRLGLIKELKAVVAGCIDSLLMFRSLLSKRRRMSFKQDVLAQEYGISTSSAHDALGDVRILELLCSKVNVTESDYVKFRKPVTKYL